MTKTERNHRRASAAAGLGVAIMTAALGIFAWQYWTLKRGALVPAFDPVIIGWQAGDWAKTPEGWEAALQFTKLRDECVYVADQVPATVLYPPEGGGSLGLPEFPLAWLADRTPGSSRPAGHHKVQRVRLAPPEAAPGERVRGQVRHDCGGGFHVVSAFELVVGEELQEAAR